MTENEKMEPSGNKPEVNFADHFDPERTAWVLWPEGNFEVLLKYLSMEASEDLFKKSNVTKFDPKTHTRVESLDEEKFLNRLSDLILSWRGATPENTKNLVPYKRGTPMDGEFPCNHTHKIMFMRRFKGFMTWVLETARELHRFDQEQKEAETKN